MKTIFIFTIFGAIVLFALISDSNAENLLCPKGQHWVQAHHRSGYTRDDGTRVSPASVIAHCQRNPPSYEKWGSKTKAGFPPRWKLKNEIPKRWSEDEKERVLDALSILPESLQLESVEGIYRLIKSELEDLNPGARRDHEIALYDEAFKEKQNLARIIGHELAHELFGQSSDRDREEYLAIGGWLRAKTPSGVPILIPTRDGYVEIDGEETPDKDFANNIEFYLFNPEKLKLKSPKIYDWIRKKYGDKFKLGKVF